MDDFAKMDIFFMVATVAVVLHAALVSVVFWYVLRLFRILERIGLEAEEELKALSEDLDEARAEAAREGRKLSRLFDIAVAALSGFLGRRRGKR